MGSGSTLTDIATVSRNWNITTRSRSAGLYALSLIDIDLTQTAQNFFGGAGPASARLPADAPTEFIFSMNPKSMDLEEPASVQIVPTQDGSQFIEHQGSIYKNITISGTTGVRPDKRGTQIIPVLGIPNPFATLNNTNNNLPPGEVSGFEALLQLRNLFRAYFDAKRDPEIAHKVVMVWQNGREGEVYVVEPITFRTKRDSSSPISTNYEIVLRTIKRLDFPTLEVTDSYAVRTGLDRLTERLNETIRIMTVSVNAATTLFDSTVGVAQATLNSVITPAQTVLNALSQVSNTAARAIAIPRNTVALLANSSLDLVQSLQRIPGEINAYKQEGISTQLSTAFNAYKNIFRKAAATYAEDTLYDQSAGAKFDTRTSAYNNPTSGPPRSGGSPTNLANVRAPAGTGITSVRSFDTIFSIAQRVLGDQARWKEIAILNGLSAPYIDVGGDGKTVLRPNDSILFPASAVDTSSVEQDLTSSTTPLTRRLGRDLKLVSFESAGGITAFDLDTNNKGDAATIEGISNLQQAIEIKFSTEKGSLPTHPTFGIAAPIGSKATLRSITAFQLDARLSLLRDARIANVSRLNFRVDGNTLSINAAVEIAGIDDSLNISFEARR